MASSVGPRAQGSDGSDYSHRERVASHYKKSAELKPKLRRVLQLQVLSAIMCLAVGVAVRYDFTFLITFSGYVCGLPLAFLALKRNNHTCLNLYGCCCSMLGVFPMIYLLYSSLWTGMVEKHRYIRQGVAAMVVILNTFGLGYAKGLMNAWSPKEKEK
jgi:hypothetical protein